LAFENSISANVRLNTTVCRPRNVLMIGMPGTGKILLARSLPALHKVLSPFSQDGAVNPCPGYGNSVTRKDGSSSIKRISLQLPSN